ncbi:MAG: HAD family phosphatase [Coprobacillus sp.]
MLKAVIFDMDGLMIDSERATYNGYVKVMNEMGLSISVDFYKTLLGKQVTFAYEQFRKVYGEDFPIEKVIDDVHEYLADIFETKGVPVKKGLVELLKYLKENGYKTIVATSSHRTRMEHILTLAGVLSYFDDSVCGNEVKNGKPNPDVFLKACEKAGVQVNEALVLEDSEAGIQAAHTASIPVICIPDMKYPEAEFEAMTTKILDSLDLVIDYIKA